ncbi:hypothetical protein KIH27_13245 [Mycobacterium sp. M1]|uniref:Low molecular weight antigen MTB12-like C-terminal domain-containing protein n=1 Tax=Mycolicibacter acidiphilus TaxID=2835306 RepID=A0ABS5RJT8_9MYCO|nr:hypothetical protein [Mycolicibacter acidiphilus]MBS9534553.1 hypothetical protein [Mycolicibacter acidiphilus]
MSVKVLAAGALAVAAIGAGGLTVAAGQPAGTVSAQVQPVVFGAPLPLEPPPAPVPPQEGQPLPSTGEVAGMLTRLTDAGVGYKEKGQLVENGIDPEDGHILDHELRKAYRDGELPYTFNVVSVSPTGPGQAIAPVEISGPKMPARTVPVTLVDQGSWVITQQSSKALLALLANR